MAVKCFLVAWERSLRFSVNWKRVISEFPRLDSSFTVRNGLTSRKVRRIFTVVSGKWDFCQQRWAWHGNIVKASNWPSTRMLSIDRVAKKLPPSRVLAGNANKHNGLNLPINSGDLYHHRHSFTGNTHPSWAHRQSWPIAHHRHHSLEIPTRLELIVNHDLLLTIAIIH